MYKGCVNTNGADGAVCAATTVKLARVLNAHGIAIRIVIITPVTAVVAAVVWSHP